MAEGGTRDPVAILIWGVFGLAVALLLAGGVFVVTYRGSAAPARVSSPASPPSASLGTSPVQGSASCSPGATGLHEIARGTAYQTTCLAAASNSAFTITFDNQDSGIPHDIHVFTDPSATHSLFTGAIVTGPATITYHLGPLPPGTYFFHCDVHPFQMTGTLVVG